MTMLMRHPLIIWLSIMLLIIQIGCTHVPPSDVPPPSEQVRAQLGTIGAVAGRFTPKGPDKPKSYRGGGGGGGAGVGWMPPEALPFILVVAGIVLLVRELTEEDEGLDSNGSRSAQTWDVNVRPQTDVRTLTKEELVGLLIHQALRDRILQVAQEHTSHRFVPLKDPPPTGRYQKVDYESVKGKDIDTVLEISVPMVGFIESSDDIGRPSVTLVMTTLARLIRVADGEEIFARTWEYGHSPTQWAANDAKLVRDELDYALQTLAQWMAYELFLN